MSKVPVSYKRTDLQSDQEVKWCPGCGDYTILASVQSFMAEMGISKEKIVFVSGIGWAARFPYYMNTYGLHTIHGRAPAVAQVSLCQTLIYQYGWSLVMVMLCQ